MLLYREETALPGREAGLLWQITKIYMPCFCCFLRLLPYREETPLPGPEAGFAGPLYSHKGPSLRLEEVWAAEVAGSTVVRGGLQGCVRWASQEAKVLSGSVPFKLQVNWGRRGIWRQLEARGVGEGEGITLFRRRIGRDMWTEI